ncbi:MAG: Rid family detoxifying hydrolase [Candidatus Micrarchaeaceae archaeon]|jgi:2-iminobutanoate/2-iminopropanoate deaminase
MKIKIEAKKGIASKFPISDGIISDNFVFTSGQIYMKDGQLLEGTIEEQTHQVMSNLKTILEAADVGFDEVVKTTIYITDMSLYGRINDVYRTYFSDPFPARETVCVKELPAGAKLEISVIATRNKN